MGRDVSWILLEYGPCGLDYEGWVSTLRVGLREVVVGGFVV